MLAVRSEFHGRALQLSLCHILCLNATWLQLAYARPQWGIGGYVPALLGGLGLIPSVAKSALIPSAPVQSQANSLGLVPSSIPSSQAPLPISSGALIPSSPHNPLIPSAPLTSNYKPIPSSPPDASVIVTSSRSDVTGTPVMQSTDQGLRPIPPAATQPGDPNGHHEITVPDFSATKPCRGCSPIVEVPATGWLESPAEEQHATSAIPIQTTVAAGPSNILISQATSGGNFVIGGTATVTPGQTITLDGAPIVIQTSAGSIEVVVGTTIIPLNPEGPKSHKGPRVTYMPTPLPPVLTIGSETVTANPQSQYVVSGQTLLPGGAAITVSGTTISLAPSATAVVVNGVSSALTPRLGNIWTMSALALTFNNHVYTANRAGYITIGPGTVLKPGGEAVTVDGTTLSLDHSGTAVVVQGHTSLLQPATTVVTLTRSTGAGGVGDANAGYTSGGAWALPTNKEGGPAKPVSAGGMLSPEFIRNDAWFGSLLILIWWGLGYLAIGL